MGRVVDGGGWRCLADNISSWLRLQIPAFARTFLLRLLDLLVVQVWSGGDERVRKLGVPIDTVLTPWQPLTLATRVTIGGEWYSVPSAVSLSFWAFCFSSFSVLSDKDYQLRPTLVEHGVDSTHHRVTQWSSGWQKRVALQRFLETLTIHIVITL